MKEFVKYDREDLRNLVEFQRWLLVAEKDLAGHLAGSLSSDMPANFSWLQLYERPFLELIAVYVKLLNLDQKIVDFANSPDPQKAVIGWGMDTEQNADVDEENRPLALAAIHALLRTCSSIGFYGYPLNSIIWIFMVGCFSHLIQLPRRETLSKRIEKLRKQCFDIDFCRLENEFYSHLSQPPT